MYVVDAYIYIYIEREREINMYGQLTLTSGGTGKVPPPLTSSENINYRCNRKVGCPIH